MTAPAPPDIVRTRRLLLLLSLGMLTVSHWNPQAAWPLHGIAVSLGLVCVLAGGGLLRLVDGERKPVRAEAVVSVAAMVLFASWWFVRQNGAPVPALGREHTGRVLQGAVLFLGLVSVLAGAEDGERVSLTRIAAAWLAGFAGLCALHGVYQTLGPAGMPGTYRTQIGNLVANREYYATGEFEGLLHALEERRASGRFGSPNVFAGFMAIALPVSLGLATMARRAVWRAVWIASAVAMVVAIALSGSRGALVAVAFSVVTFAVLLGGRGALLRRSAVATLFALFLCGAAGESDGKTDFERRWLGISTLQQRAHYWEAGLSMWGESPLLGRGPGAFEVLYASHRVPDSQETRLAHNWFVEFGAATGAIGLLLFLAAAGGGIVAGVRSVRDSGETGLLAVALSTAALTALLHGLVEFTFQFTEVWLDFCLVLALCAMLPTSGRSFPVPGRGGGATLIAMAVLALPGWWFTVMRPMMAEWNRTLGEYAMTDGDAGEAMSHTARAIEWQPDDPDLYHARGELLWRSGRSPVSSYERARELNPWSARTVEGLAMWKWRQSDDAGAAVVLQREAVSLHPLDAHHTMRLATMLWEAGETEEARELAARARELRRSYAEDLELKELEALVAQ